MKIHSGNYDFFPTGTVSECPVQNYSGKSRDYPPCYPEKIIIFALLASEAMRLILNICVNNRIYMKKYGIS